MQTPSLLITGATGTIGLELTTLLQQKGYSFRVMVRSLEKAEVWKSVPSVEVVIGDFNEPESLEKALTGIDRAFLLTNSSAKAEEQQLAFVAAAQQTGLKQLVKLSQFAAEVHSPVRFLRYHAIVEKAIQDAGISYTFLRPNLFMQGLLGFKDVIQTKGMFFASAGDAPVSVIDIRDIARVAFRCLTEDGHAGKIYPLTGPQALTHTAMAAELSRAVGKEIRYVDVEPEVMHQALLEVGFPEWQAAGLIEDYAHYSRGEASLVTPTVAEVTGQSASPFSRFANDYRAVFGK
ncbi:SDR family oxidoreductase [Siphonobacter sp. SORGH_AS_1065]|uniref:SDR family oxidoreductase n=1 Tax=Siphonobacter sp. SORGH_AS_1065 TaxID=3041795 RepID=UPI00277FD929|nr:SDR family oxidoreductase [Siphonobacter sp. SORGH_AS_1065]MDQ1089651.1 uncharacterized protein YbjT (DUF2867 family) [Siphonobacter sp. SORGH_AS_1065]